MKIAVDAPRTIGSEGHLEYSIFFRVNEEATDHLVDRPGNKTTAHRSFPMLSSGQYRHGFTC